MRVKIGVWRVLDGRDEKKFEGGHGRWGTIYLDYIETIQIWLNTRFRLLGTGFFDDFLTIFQVTVFQRRGK